MTIHKSVTSERRAIANKYDISRWTSSSNNQALYKSLASGANEDMMKSDNLLFNPHQMIAGSAVSQATADPSYQRFDVMQMRPVYYYAGGFLLFLVVMKYLTSSPTK